jgi:hypothetical protein
VFVVSCIEDDISKVSGHSSQVAANVAMATLMLESPDLRSDKELYCQSHIMRLQYLDGFKAKAEASKSIHTRERRKNETGARSKKDAIGSLVASRMSDGSDVEYGKKEFVILKLPDVVTSVSFLFPQILLHTKHANKEQALLGGFRKDKTFSSIACTVVQFKISVVIDV